MKTASNSIIKSQSLLAIRESRVCKLDKNWVLLLPSIIVKENSFAFWLRIVKRWASLELFLSYQLQNKFGLDFKLKKSKIGLASWIGIVFGGHRLFKVLLMKRYNIFKNSAKKTSSRRWKASHYLQSSSLLWLLLLIPRLAAPILTALHATRATYTALAASVDILSFSARPALTAQLQVQHQVS